VNESEYAGGNAEDIVFLRQNLSGMKLTTSVKELEHQYHPSKSLSKGDLDSNTGFSAADLTEHQLLLLYPTTFAFALSSKQWSKLASISR
jgi:hypothetical protein